MMYQNPYMYTQPLMYQANQPVYNQVQPQPSQNQVQNNGIVWVQGIEGAKAFQLAPNSNAILMDSDDSKFYIKSTDAVGMATLKVFSFEEVVNQQPVVKSTDNYVTKEEFNKLKGEIGDYINNILTKSGVMPYESTT